MMVEELQERLRKANAQLDIALEEQRKKEKKVAEGEEALRNLRQKATNAGGSLHDFSKRAMEKLDSFDGLKFYKTYKEWFLPNFDYKTDQWMGQWDGIFTNARNLIRDVMEQEEEKKARVDRLKREVENLRREIERAASIGE